MFKVKCAGLPDEGQKEIKTFDEFYYGLTFIPDILLNEEKTKYKKKIGSNEWNELPSNCIPIGKLAQKNVRGGIYLCPCLFSIRIPDYIKLQNDINFNDFDLNTLIL